jgi:transposase
VARRARIVLLCDEGVSDREVSRRLGTHRHTVAVWRKRFEEGGIAALAHDRPGRGRKPCTP